jgi:hypothetical protein
MTRMPEIQEVLDLLEKLRLEVKAVSKKVEALQLKSRAVGSYAPWYTETKGDG